MTPKQRVMLTQLQLTGLGIIFLGFGIAWHKTWLVIFGILLGLYGLIRLFVLKKLLEQSEDPTTKNQDALSSTIQQIDDLDLKDEDEYIPDEWESKLESYLEKRYNNKNLHVEEAKSKSKSKPQ